MKFTVIILPSADEDLLYFTAYEQRIILTGIATHLYVRCNISNQETKETRFKYYIGVGVTNRPLSYIL
jgi:hypothetical protein